MACSLATITTASLGFHASESARVQSTPTNKSVQYDLQPQSGAVPAVRSSRSSENTGAYRVRSPVPARLDLPCRIDLAPIEARPIKCKSTGIGSRPTRLRVLASKADTTINRLVCLAPPLAGWECAYRAQGRLFARFHIFSLVIVTGRHSLS
jgi:hypothetical protein